MCCKSISTPYIPTCNLDYIPFGNQLISVKAKKSDKRVIKSEEKGLFEFGNPIDLNPTFLGLEIRLVKDDLVFPDILKVDFWEKSQQIL